jgi:hypothetical protein
MGNIFFSIKFNRILLCGTLIAFSLTSIPFPCYSQTNVGVNELAFAFRIEQLLEKVKKAVDKKDSNKLIDLMFDVKREVEAYSGTSIDLDKQLNAVEAEIKKKGAPIPKKEFKGLRDKLKMKEKRLNHRAQYLESYLLNGEQPYILEDEQMLFSATQERGKEKNTGVVVPIQLTIGVTVALVGFFIMIVPVIPLPIKAWGKDMVVYGVGIAAEACYTAYDEKNKK